MPDREKVIKGLEYCMGGCQVSCFKCPYREIGHQPPDCLDNCMILQDAVDLLKEQEPLVIHKCGFTATCPECNLSWMMWQPDYMRYCPYCGKAVKWE